MNSDYNNRQRNYSQSPQTNNTRYPDSQNKIEVIHQNIRDK